MPHRRSNEVLKEHWEAVRAGRPMPLEADIDPDELQEIWGACFVVEIRNDDTQRKYRYNYLGQQIVEAFGDDLTGHEVCEEVMSPTEHHMLDYFRKVIETNSPVYFETEFENTHHMLIKCRASLLPLIGTQLDQVGYIIGTMKWKAC